MLKKIDFPLKSIFARGNGSQGVVFTSKKHFWLYFCSISYRLKDIGKKLKGGLPKCFSNAMKFFLVFIKLICSHFMTQAKFILKFCSPMLHPRVGCNIKNRYFRLSKNMTRNDVKTSSGRISSRKKDCKASPIDAELYSMEFSQI